MSEDVRVDRVGPTHTIDTVDRQILELLHGDARMSTRAIAREVGMSPGAISERVSRMEAAGVIRGYRADVDFSRLGLHLEAIVGLQTNQGTQLERIIRALTEIEEVRRVHIVSGPWDLIVLLQVADHVHLRSVIVDKIWVISGFQHSETMISMASHPSPVAWEQLDTVAR